MKTKEQLIRELPQLAAELQLGMANCLSDMVASAFAEDRKRERYFFAAAMKLRYRLERIAELTLLLPTLPYELVPAEELERISADAADAWWVTEELRRADEEMGEAVRAACGCVGKCPDGVDLLHQRNPDAQYQPHRASVKPTPPSCDVKHYEEPARLPVFQNGLPIDLRCSL